MVNLTIVICSFGRLDPLQTTLDALFSSDVRDNEILNLKNVFIIDQANAVADLVSKYGKKVRRFQQDNFGGSGGFTRGIIEALDEGAEWILLMDDDAVPDTSSFTVLTEYIKKQNHTNYALHGAMFSLSDHGMICEAGANNERPESRRFGITPRLAGHRPVQPLINDPKLARDTAVDYGAWWFFCVHANSVKRVGLPLPLFIRGDDREYGLRLNRAGIPTIALPGLRIWHPPHDERPDRWQMLYDWRNTFITKAIYIGGSKGRVGLPWRFFWRTYRMVIGGFYETAELMIAGLEEYLKGPLHCVNAHRETLQRSRFIDGMYSSSGELNNVKIDWIMPIKSWDKLRFAFQMMTFNGLLLPAKRTNGDEISSFHSNQIDWRLTYRLPRFAVAYKGNPSLKIYVRSRSVVRSQIIRLSRITWSYFKNYRYLSEEWKAKAIDFSTEDFWRTYLSIDKR
jgi:galactofuranosylgalactofuranosylrhamnosyl-N-acetylglucosaminyl-diphospho-decaprenol beta-1,5/1,6-galactofuranosyltransferase